MLPALAIVALAICAYANSLHGVFLFDDGYAINARQLVGTDAWGCLGSVRGLVQCTLALDYRRGGLSTLPYHVTNLVIHIGSALVLLGVLRRALGLARPDGSVAIEPRAAERIAVIVALLFAVHPLQTESVTYIVQRAESLVGLFYLLTVLAFLRRTDGHPAWSLVAVASCFLGTCTKPVIVTAPLCVLLLDRTLVAGSFVGALRRRPLLYLGLFSTWLWLYRLLDGGRQLVASGHGGAGFDGAGVGLTPLRYLVSQGGSILLYLKLALVPHPLCLDYARPATMGSVDVALALVVASIVLVGLWSLSRRRVPGLLVVLFFLVLAPTSSVMPIADITVEHRMYLPLALVLLGLALLARKHAAASPRGFVAIGIAGAVVLGTLTHLRNRDYLSEKRMYAQMLEVNPTNTRAAFNLAGYLLADRDFEGAIATYRRVLELDPTYVDAASYLAVIYLERGDRARARAVLDEALVHVPASHTLHLGLAKLAEIDGDRPRQRALLVRAVELGSDSAPAHAMLGRLFLEEGDRLSAADHLTRAAKLDAESVSDEDLARAGLHRP